MKEIITESIKYWEKKRIIYNLGLLLVVVLNFTFRLPESLDRLCLEFALQLFILTLVANILYSTAYIVDVFVQHSDFSSSWKKYRWILFIIGFSLASILAWFISTGLFTSSHCN